MPTGYTSDLHDGEQSFKDFVLWCARGWGVAIMMRDDEKGPIELEKVRNGSSEKYHEEMHQKAIDTLRRYQSMSVAEWEQMRDQEFAEQTEAHHQAHLKTEEIRLRYAQMIEKVQSWVAPDMEGFAAFKAFMLDQLQKAKAFDCGRIYPPLPDKQTVKAFREAKEERALSDIKYHSEHLEETRKLNEERYEWAKALIESVEEHAAEVDAVGT